MCCRPKETSIPLLSSFSVVGTDNNSSHLSFQKVRECFGDVWHPKPKAKGVTDVSDPVLMSCISKLHHSVSYIIGYNAVVISVTVETSYLSLTPGTVMSVRIERRHHQCCCQK